jgi:outer membrane protein TolC
MQVRRLVCALSLGLALAPRPARAEAPLGLDDAVTLALTNNERALKAPLRVEAAQGQLERARAAFLPTLVAGGTGQLHSIEDRSGRILAGSGNITLNQPLLNLPAFPLYAQAKHQLESERWGAVQDKRQLAFDTAHAFLLALTNERVLEAAKGRLDRARENQQTADARAQAQLASTNDVTRAIIETTSATREVAQAQGNLTRAYLQLGFLVGKPITGNLSAPDRVTQTAEHSALRTEDVAQMAEARRADVRSAHERTEALRESAREPLFRLAPTIGASAQIHAVVAPIAPDPVFDETLQLTLSWNIYDAGVRYADRKTRVAQAESQALDEKALRRSIATDVNIALTALRAARESYRISEEAVDAAKRNTTETEILYAQGLARAIEVSDANGQRFDAEVNRATAKLSMQQAYLDLRDALGLGPVGEELQPSVAAPKDGATAPRGAEAAPAGATAAKAGAAPPLPPAPPGPATAPPSTAPKGGTP